MGARMTPEEAMRRVEKAKKFITQRMHAAASVTQIQKASASYFPANGDRIWSSQVSLQIGTELDLEHKFLQAVCDLADRPREFVTASTTCIKGEWVGARAPHQSPPPSLVSSEIERYRHLEAATTTPLCILYLHGGGFITGSPYHSRLGFSARITELTGGKCFGLEYRLAPQNAFPTALYDVLLAYLYLLYPPGGAFHTAISAHSIILAGDSAGGNFCLAFIQLLLHLRKQHKTVQYNGRDVELVLPAGVSVMSAYVDQTDCMPSWRTTTSDWLFAGKYATTPFIVHDALWPSDPLRASFFCHDRDLCHPLASPMGALDWTGSPPIWFCVGEEKVADSCKVIAQRAVKHGVSVIWNQFLGVPHAWHLLPGLEQLPQTLDCFLSWAHFCKTCVPASGSLDIKPLSVQNPETWIQEVNPTELLSMSFEEVRSRMDASAREICRSIVANTGGMPKL